MKRLIFCFCFVFCIALSQAKDGEEKEVEAFGEKNLESIEEEAPELPEWEQDELDELESGGYVPGSSLMGSLARDFLESGKDEVIDFSSELPVLPEEDSEKDEQPQGVPDVYLTKYFEEAPDGLLNNPQQLLTRQESDDLSGTLSYHARDVGIAYYLYLFDGKQRLPEGMDIGMLLEKQFVSSEPVAVVFYFLGEPGRSEIEFTGLVKEVSREEERQAVCENAITEALQKSDPLSQLEVFAIEVSLELGQLEKEIMTRHGAVWDIPGAAPEGAEPVEKEKSLARIFLENERVFWIVTGGVLLVLAAFLGWLGRWIGAKRKAYHFPDAEGTTLLDAPYAAGVGGVIFFVSANNPPSSQKDDIPDYLQRL